MDQHGRRMPPMLLNKTPAGLRRGAMEPAKGAFLPTSTDKKPEIPYSGAGA